MSTERKEFSHVWQIYTHGSFRKRHSRQKGRVSFCHHSGGKGHCASERKDSGMERPSGQRGKDRDSEETKVANVALGPADTETIMTITKIARPVSRQTRMWTSLRKKSPTTSAKVVTVCGCVRWREPCRFCHSKTMTHGEWTLSVDVVVGNCEDDESWSGTDYNPAGQSTTLRDFGNRSPNCSSSAWHTRSR